MEKYGEAIRVFRENILVFIQSTYNTNGILSWWGFETIGNE